MIKHLFTYSHAIPINKDIYFSSPLGKTIPYSHLQNQKYYCKGNWPYVSHYTQVHTSRMRERLYLHVQYVSILNFFTCECLFSISRDVYILCIF